MKPRETGGQVTAPKTKPASKPIGGRRTYLPPKTKPASKPIGGRRTYAAPKRYTPPANFHTEAQNHAGTVATQKKLKRAVTPLRAAPKVDAHHQALQDHEAKRALKAWRKHFREVIAQHDQDPKGLHIAATLLSNEIAPAHDQNRLRDTALDRKESASRRLSSARELRNRYGLPMTTAQLTAPDRIKRVNEFLKETDRAIARGNKSGRGGVTPLAAATADFNPVHVANFLHTLGALSTAGAGSVVGALSKGQTGQPDLTPRIVKKIGTNALKDLLDLPAQSVVSAYDIGSAGWQAALKAQGHGGSYKPIKDVAKSTKQLLEHPTKHPLAAALVLRGGVGAVDRAAGGAVRTVTRGKVAGTGGRAAVKLYGKQEVERRYATGLTTNVAQRVLDAKRPGATLYNKFARPVKDAKRELAAAEGHRGAVAHPTEDLRQVADRVTAAKQTLEGRKVGKHEALPMMRDRYLTKRVDEAVAAAEDQRSATVIRARKDLRASLPRGLRPALRPVLEAKIKSPETAVSDIKAELARLKAEHAKMQADGEPRWRVRRNERQQHHYEGLLENKKFLEDPVPVFEAADKFIETQRQMEAKLAEHGLLDPERALRSKLIDFATREMGARFDEHSQTILAEDGTPLPNETILSAMHDAGVRFKGGTPDRQIQVYDRAATEKSIGRYRLKQDAVRAKAEVDAQASQDALAVERQKFQRQRGLIQRMLQTREQKLRELEHEDDGSHAALDEIGRLEDEVSRLEDDLQNLHGAEAWATMKHNVRDTRALEQQFKNLPTAHELPPERVTVPGRLGEPQVGFVSQRGDLGRLSDYFKDSTKQPSGYFQKRTGESAVKGLHTLGFKSVEAQLTHSLNVLAQAEGANEILDRFGLKPKGDIAFTDYKVAQNAATAAADRTGQGWVPVRIGQAVGEQLRAIHEHIDPAAVDMLPDSAQLPGKPTWLVMPSTVATRFQEHSNTLGSNTFQLGFQALTHAFRNTVLPLSPRWLAGNVVELVIRGTVEGTGPLSWAVGHTLLKRVRNMDEGAYNEFVARAQSGSLYASQVKQDHYLGIERWTDRGMATHFAKPVIYGFHHKLSPATHLSWLYGKYASAIKWITPRIEKEFQAAAIGKAALHEMRDMNGNWLNALPHWTAAIDDVSRGLLNTNKQIQFAEYVDKVVGRYNKLSPAGRRVVSGYMPFAMWYANAVRFVFVTLPKDHPVIQGWIAAGYVHTEKERLAEGKSLTQTIPDGKKRIPDFLQGTITTKGGSHLPLQHYTPWGAFSDVGSLQGLVLPQINALPLAIAGKNWKLEDLKGAEGEDLTSIQARLKIGMYTATEALLPGLAVARRVREQGGSSLDDSTLLHPKVRPGTKVGYLGSQGSLRKIADPFRSYPSSGANAPRTQAGSGSGSARGNRFLQGGRSDTSSPAASTGNRFLDGG